MTDILTEARIFLGTIPESAFGEAEVLISRLAQELEGTGWLVARSKCLAEWENVNDPPCHPGDDDWRPCQLCRDVRLPRNLNFDQLDALANAWGLTNAEASDSYQTMMDCVLLIREPPYTSPDTSPEVPVPAVGASVGLREIATLAEHGSFVAAAVGANEEALVSLGQLFQKIQALALAPPPGVSGGEGAVSAWCLNGVGVTAPWPASAKPQAHQHPDLPGSETGQ